MSKGSAPRPFDVDRQAFENNWDAIFNKIKDVQDQSDDSQERAEKPKDADPGVPKGAE